MENSNNEQTLEIKKSLHRIHKSCPRSPMLDFKASTDPLNLCVGLASTAFISFSKESMDSPRFENHKFNIPFSFKSFLYLQQLSPTEFYL